MCVGTIMAFERERTVEGTEPGAGVLGGGQNLKTEIREKKMTNGGSRWNRKMSGNSGSRIDFSCTAASSRASVSSCRR